MVTVTIIIPVYNERPLIAELLAQVIGADTSPFRKEIIVVDDGSTDGTAEELRKFDGRGVRVITHAGNMGKSAAIKSALPSATGDIILIQDADLEYSPRDYKRLLAPFRERNAKAVYGSRFLASGKPAGMKMANRLANKVFTFLVNFLYGAGITDEGTGYKLFAADVLRAADIRCSGFEFCPEVTVKLLKRGIDIIEVPVSYRARDRSGGKKPGIMDGIRVLWTIIKYKFIE